MTGQVHHVETGVELTHGLNYGHSTSINTAHDKDEPQQAQQPSFVGQGVARTGRYMSSRVAPGTSSLQAANRSFLEDGQQNATAASSEEERTETTLEQVSSGSHGSSSNEDLAHHLETMHAGLRNAQFLRSAVYGGIDGVITTFSIISSAHGANLGYGVTVALGIANVLADGFSMGFGDYISGKLEKSYVEGERGKELAEFRRKPKHEMAEMVEMLEKAENMQHQDAKTLVRVMAKYEHMFIRNMMQYELNLNAETESTGDLVKNGVATCSSFLLFGCLPLSVYFIGFGWPEEDRDSNAIYAVACIVCAIALFAVGAFSAILVKQDRGQVLNNGTVTLLNGAVAASLSYVVGFLCERALTGAG
ncbi:unnamed protein product [Amoebophrya sp. A25]|nr:unnamed protein product [Amoebophrya sp. A25]|eukprot:GSA25T00008832001.1